MAIEAQTGGSWQQIPLEQAVVGLNRAEIEGRVPQIIKSPGILKTLAHTHAKLRPEAPPWTGVRLVRIETIIEQRRPTGQVRREVLASWSRAA